MSQQKRLERLEAFNPQAEVYAVTGSDQAAYFVSGVKYDTQEALEAAYPGERVSVVVLRMGTQLLEVL